jgi:hypothetical protein
MTIAPHFSRHRTRTDERNISSTRYKTDINPIIGSISQQHSADVNFWTSFEEMYDSVNPKGPSGRRAPGPCSSFRIHRRGGGFNELVDWQDGPDGDFQSLYTDNPSTFHFHYDKFRSFPSPVPSSLLRDNLLAAWSKMITQIPTDVMLANFLWEARELKSSVDHYRKAVTPPNFKFKGKKMPGLKLTDLPGWANATFLDASFNLLPMVADLQKMTQVYDRVASRIAFLLANRSRPIQQHFSNLDFWADNPDVGRSYDSGTFDPPWNAWYQVGTPTASAYLGRGPNYGDNHGHAQFVCASTHSVFNVTWTLFQELEGLDDAWAQLRGLIVGLGLNNPAKIVWNAIPFSFVLDWFEPFGKVLDRFAAQPFIGVWDVYDVSYSIKRSYTFIESILHRPDKNPPWISFVDMELYDRRLGIPIESILNIDPSQLTDIQQRLFTSLALNLTLFHKH